MGDNDNKQCSSGHHHMGLMLVGCIIMMGALWFFVGRGSTGNFSYWPLLLICPLIHVLMMFGLFKGFNNQDEEKEPEDKNYIDEKSYNENSL